VFVDETPVAVFDVIFSGLSGADPPMEAIVLCDKDGDLIFCIPESIESGHMNGVSSNWTDELCVSASSLLNVDTSTHRFYVVTYDVVLWSPMRPNSIKAVDT